MEKINWKKINWADGIWSFVLIMLVTDIFYFLFSNVNLIVKILAISFVSLLEIKLILLYLLYHRINKK